MSEDLFRFARGEFFESGKRAACGQTRIFQKRRIQQEGAAIHERMVGCFKWLAAAAFVGSFREDRLIHLEIGLKLERSAGIPLLLTGQSGEKFLAESRGVFAGQRIELAFIACSGGPAEKVEGASRSSEERLALNQGEKIAVETSVNLQAVAAVLDNVGIDEARNDAVANKAFAEALRKKSSPVGAGAFGFCRCGHVATHSSSSEVAGTLFEGIEEGEPRPAIRRREADPSLAHAMARMSERFLAPRFQRTDLKVGHYIHRASKDCWLDGRDDTQF